MEMALSITPIDHPDRALLLNNLASMLLTRYNQTGNMDDLEAAISKAELAVFITPIDHPGRGIFLYNLGNNLSIRYYRMLNMDDLHAALKSFTGSFDLPSAAPLIRVKSARNALRIMISMENWDQASSLAHTALKLLPFLCDRYLSRTDQQYAISQISGLAADACSLSLQVGSVHHAIQQLEFGRAVILGYLMDGRNDLTRLQNDHPHLANIYGALRSKAYTDVEAMEPVLREQLLRERREAATQLEDCLHQIRQRHGYERFLFEPTLDELKKCATEGPIVIVNATDIRCDAIIVSTSEVQAIALPRMNSSEAPSFFQKKLGRYRIIDHEQWKKYGRDIEAATGGEPDINADVKDMSWLWSSCVKPILEELKDSQASGSHEPLRVWWIGTGIACSFPFHAAGLYDQDFGDNQGSENTLSQIIPSYTPTIKALSYARSCATRAAEISSRETSILIVTMPSTPEQRTLPGVDREKLAIQHITRDVYRMKALESPTADHVLESMSGFDIIHFACHGSADPENPSDSHLMLQKTGP